MKRRRCCAEGQGADSISALEREQEREKMSVRKQTGRANAADEKEVGGSHLTGGEPKTDRQTGRQAP